VDRVDPARLDVVADDPMVFGQNNKKACAGSLQGLARVGGNDSSTVLLLGVGMHVLSTSNQD
jgi:hypothetical protein